MVALTLLLFVALAPAADEARCPTPRVTGLAVRPVSDDGYRISVRIRAETERGGIGALTVTYRKRTAAILDIFGGRRVSLATEHRYPRAGAYTVSVVAEGSTGRCPLKKSALATLRVRIPLSPTSYPRSL